MKAVKLLGYLFAFRIANALLCTTFFQPDEFFQSLEVAHRLVFGYGWQTWEWRPETAIRSPLHALIFVPGYWLVKAFKLEQTYALIAVPKILQGVIAALNDYYTAKLACKLFRSDAYANVALFCSVASFFNAGATIRTFSNSLETTLTAAALSCFPWNGDGSFGICLLIAGISCIIRPTSAVLWSFLALSVVSRQPASFFRLLRQGALPFLFCVALCLTVDTWFYGRPIFTPLNFLRVNVVQQISLFYGANAWHFYITQALPFNMLAMLPFTVHGSWLLLRSRSTGPALTMLLVALASMAALSLLSHKEFRFIQPLLPMLHCVTAYSLARSSASKSTIASTGYSWMPMVQKAHINLILYINIPAALFFICVHQKGQVTITDYIRGTPAKYMESVGFLMPCHSTPWQSHIHRPDLERHNMRSGYGGKLWALSCEPPVNGQSVEGYLDEDTLFHRDPCAFVAAHFPNEVNGHPATSQSAQPEAHLYIWPSHIAVFDYLLSETCKTTGQPFRLVLERFGYVEKKRFWNTFWHEDPRRAGDVILLEQRKSRQVQ